MWIRLANFVCVALMGMAILANYHISEQTRLAAVALKSVDHSIAQERASTTVLGAEWERVADPARVQALAQTKLSMSDAATAQLASLELLPRSGNDTSLGGADVRQASDQVPAQTVSPELTQVSDKPEQ
jgi:hypothetical protein